MGADLYIQSIFEENRKRYEPKFDGAVKRRDAAKASGLNTEAEIQQKLASKYYALMYSDGYFRDSYNGTSLFRLLGMSWWKDFSRLIDVNSKLHPTKAHFLLSKLNGMPLPKVNREYLISAHCTVAEHGENSVEDWNKYFEEKFEDFKKFLKLAVELDEAIDCSI